MKKITLLAFAIFLVFTPLFLVATPVVADFGETPPPGMDIPEAIDRLIALFFGFFITVAAVAFIYGAYVFLISGQSPEGQAKGKTIITYAIVAVLVAVLAQALVRFIRDTFEGANEALLAVALQVLPMTQGISVFVTGIFGA